MTNLRKAYHTKMTLSADEWFLKYKQIFRDKPYHFLLESARGGRYSIFGILPYAVLSGKGSTLTALTDTGVEMQEGKLLDLVQEWMKPFHSETEKKLPDFQGGAIGYINYDIARQIEELPSFAADDIAIPDLYFVVYEDVGVYDHHSQELWFISNVEEHRKAEAMKRLDSYKEEWSGTFTEDFSWTGIEAEGKPASFSMTEGEFATAVKKVKEYISSGDVFQVNLSLRESRPIHSEPFHIYEKLRELNPSPYMAMLHTPDFDIVSASPELLIKKKGKELSTRPIAGTRSRGHNDEEDKALAKTLIENEKEQAEHVMLVDLERNDLGRVCKFGSVEVNEFMVIEKYSHVMHIVSNVRGVQEDGKDAFDAIKATFPGGTITGAPKIRTMEIIEELEPVRRNLYTGSIGWLGFNRDMELNIAIRTMIIKDKVAHVQAGAGIVIDSNPRAEYKESMKKAKALWKAKELSEAEIKQTVENR
ncbi:anthranilate synthase component I family protein [Pseudalkalibacillus caeni]|uniref:Anthranilate synthase component I family protein n=1 Tax=Exobacillus caeni TaxID=2574798 RepID=A0A5R9EW21_9BACL|nr:anthranilate synthase component I family protein [Pseudalkalibacillus caeni]TLS35001.1 anthranilate synthase component I family protein [Pseudalkalibacillus caeni]